MERWNYRVVESRDDEGESFFEIREVHYDEDDSVWGISEEAIAPSGNSLDELRADLERMLTALGEPTLNEDDFEFEDDEEAIPG